MLPIPDLSRPLPRHRPLLFALGGLPLQPMARDEDCPVRQISPELLPLIRQLSFEADLWLIHSREYLETALNLCSPYGEGILSTRAKDLADIAYHSSSSSHSSLSSHIWAGVTLGQWGAAWFARAHRRGLQARCVARDAEELSRFCAQLADQRIFLRDGAEPRLYQQTAEALPMWRAARDELDLRTGLKVTWNIGLIAGRVMSGLSAFDRYSRRIPEPLASRLGSLNYRRPDEIISHDARLKILLEALRTPSVRIEPELKRVFLNALDDSEQRHIREGIKRHHWQRYLELKKTDPVKALEHRKLSESVRLQ